MNDGILLLPLAFFLPSEGKTYMYYTVLFFIVAVLLILWCVLGFREKCRLKVRHKPPRHISLVSNPVWSLPTFENTGRNHVESDLDWIMWEGGGGEVLENGSYYSICYFYPSKKKNDVLPSWDGFSFIQRNFKKINFLSFYGIQMSPCCF